MRHIPARTALAALLIIALAACTAGTPDGSGSRSSGVPGTTGTPEPGGSRGTVVPGGGESTSPTPLAAGTDFVVTGRLNDGRMIAMRGVELLRTARDRDVLHLQAISAVVGGATEVLPFGRNLLVAATNHPDVVAITDDFRTVRTITSMQAEFGVTGSISYGSIVRRGPDALITAHIEGSSAADDKIGIIAISLRDFTIRQRAIYPTRVFPHHPQACATTDGTLAIVTAKGQVDLLDLATLARRKTAPVSDRPVSVTCLGRRVWVGDGYVGTGTIVDSAGTAVGSFHWPGGDGVDRLAPNPVTGGVAGIDPGAGLVFTCPPNGGTCRTVAVDGKPNDLLVYRDKLLVTLEYDQSIAVLDARTLSVVGTVAVGDMPRTLAVLPGPPL